MYYSFKFLGCTQIWAASNFLSSCCKLVPQFRSKSLVVHANFMIYRFLPLSSWRFCIAIRNQTWPRFFWQESTSCWCNKVSRNFWNYKTFQLETWILCCHSDYFWSQQRRGISSPNFFGEKWNNWKFWIMHHILIKTTSFLDFQ